MCRELGCPHPEERACRTGSANSNGRARASRRMRTAVPPHASRRRLRRLLSMRESQHEGITIARAGRRAKQGLWLFPVFVLFRPVIGGKASRPKKRRRRAFPLLIRWLRGNTKRRVVAGRLFFPCYLQETAPRRGSPSHVAAGGADHYLTRVGGGAVEG